jgi:hypothetical protein
MKHDSNLKNDRRQFILKTFSSCAFCCLATSSIFASSKTSSLNEADEDHKFLLDSEMSLQEVYNFAFKQWYIPAMKNLIEQIGKEKFIELLKTSSEMIYESDKESEINYDERTLTAFSKNIKDACENWRDRLTFEILNDDEEVFEIKFTECLWAKTFREANASEIGYAGVCYQDYGMTKQFNPKLNLDRKKTLMQGNDFCHFKWSMQI